MENFHKSIKKRLQDIRKEVSIYKLKEEIKDEKQNRSGKYTKKRGKKRK